MKRIVVYLPEPAADVYQDKAAELGIKVSELVRQILIKHYWTELGPIAVSPYPDPRELCATCNQSYQGHAHCRPQHPFKSSGIMYTEKGTWE